jgi:hypothetical protein
MSVAATVVFLLIAAFGLALVEVYGRGPVSRQRVDRFARRQQLTVTVDNGNQVIRYLATTRRWRVAGLVGGIAASQIGAPEGTIVNFNFVTIFAGWFLGALVAEVRVEHLAHGRVRAASLRPRRPEQYVARFAWALVPAAAVVAVATGAATAAAGALGWAEPNWTWAGVWLLVALTVAATVRAFQHVVLRRPQPLAAPDVIAADDAIRSRALHVLSGGGAALVLFLTLSLLANLRPTAVGAQQVVGALIFVSVFAIALLGWLVATSMWPPGRRAVAPAGPWADRHEG